MAKDNEKKVSGEMNAEELENVAGGWCFTGGKSIPKWVKNVSRIENGGGHYTIKVEFDDGNEVQSVFGADGKLVGSGDVFNNRGAAPLPR